MTLHLRLWSKSKDYYTIGNISSNRKIINNNAMQPFFLKKMSISILIMIIEYYFVLTVHFTFAFHWTFHIVYYVLLWIFSLIALFFLPLSTYCFDCTRWLSIWMQEKKEESEDIRMILQFDENILLHCSTLNGNDKSSLIEYMYQMWSEVSRSNEFSIIVQFQRKKNHSLIFLSNIRKSNTWCGIFHLSSMIKWWPKEIFSPNRFFLSVILAKKRHYLATSKRIDSTEFFLF